MCGIAGIYSPFRVCNKKDLIHDMIFSIKHRGPDDAGYALFNLEDMVCRNFSSHISANEAQVLYPSITENTPFPYHLAFGQNRFSIIDLSFNGHQPFWDHSNSYSILFNGEIYNYLEIRETLIKSGIHFRTNSDTEVVLEGYKLWGYDVFKLMNGPWAISIYDSKAKRIVLCRDRIGKNPFYYSIKDDTLVWCSEIKGIFAYFQKHLFEINEQAIYEFIAYSIRDARNQTFWKDIHSLEQATVYEYDISKPSLQFNQYRYWTIPTRRCKQKDIPFNEAKTQFLDLLTDAIRIRLRADVPIAYTLSGGLDSSTMIALGARFLPDNIHAYTVKFEDADEVAFAEKVVQAYPEKIIHHIISPHQDDFWNQADDFIRLEEEPFHSPNLLTDYNIQRLLRSDGFKVMINGAAGDEVLAGYEEYFKPLLLKQFADCRYLRALKNILFYSHHYDHQLNKVKTIIGLLYKRHFKYYLNTPSLDYYSGQSKEPLFDLPTDIESLLLSNMSDTKMNYWMRSSNKTYFGIPLEIRCPFLDYRIVDLAFQLPLEYLINNGWHKYILRHLADDFLPESVTWRKQKMGFPFPYRSWLEYSKPIILNNIQNLECPYINIKKYIENYDNLKNNDPHLNWRLLSVLLWWKRVILDQPIINDR